MIEMLGVLAIIGVLSAGGIMGYSVAMENYRVNKLITDIQMIAQQVVTMYDNHKAPTVTKVVEITEQLKGLGIIPKEGYKIPMNKAEMLVRHREYTNHNNIVVANGDFDILSPRKEILFTLGAMPKSVCVKLFAYNWGNSGYMLASPYLNSTDVWYDKPLSPSVAETLCKTYGARTMFVFVAYQGRKVPK